MVYTPCTSVSTPLPLLCPVYSANTTDYPLIFVCSWGSYYDWYTHREVFLPAQVTVCETYLTSSQLVYPPVRTLRIHVFQRVEVLGYQVEVCNRPRFVLWVKWVWCVSMCVHSIRMIFLHWLVDCSIPLGDCCRPLCILPSPSLSLWHDDSYFRIGLFASSFPILYPL